MPEKKINVLYVITKLELGGAQTHALDLIRSIDQNKFKVFLFSAREGLLVEQALNIPGLNFYRSSFLERRIHLVKDICTVISLYFYIKKHKIDFIHTHSSKAGILGRFAAKAAGLRGIVHTVHGWSFHEYQSKVVYNIFLYLERLCARFTDRLIVVSLLDRETGVQLGVGPPEKYRLIRCGLDAERFSVKGPLASARAALGLSETDLVVGMVACFKPQKDPLSFVRLAAAVREKLPHVRFFLVGDGVLRGEIARLIGSFGLQENILLLGWRRDMPLIYAAMDLCVLTSLWEGLPIAIMEAMASGVPVIVTDTGGVRDVVRDGETGYLVKAADVEAMRDKVILLLKDPELREDIAGRAVEWIRNDLFSLRHMMHKVEGLYQELWIKHG